MPHVRFWLCFLLLVGSCSSGDGVELIVNLRSDYIPQVDFTRIRVAISSGGSETADEFDAANIDYAIGQRITTFEDVSPGAYTVRAELLASDGRRVGARSIAVSLSESFAATVVITRSCEGIQCPQAGAPDLSQCSGGRCVAPECTPETPEFCIDGCLSDEDCLSPVACAEGRCLAEGACIFVPNADSCDATELCDVEAGCIPRPDLPVDAGVDTGPAECGMPCELADRPCAIGTFDCSTGSPVCVETGAGNAGAVCREAVDACDEADVCDGESPECPEEDLKKPAGFVCNAARDECDQAETCDGTSNACPPDLGQPVGTPCPGGFCNGDNMCSSECEPGAPCNPEGMPCATGRTDCSSGVPQCTPSGNQANGVECDSTEIGGWGVCADFGGACGERGTRMRTVTDFECFEGSCVPNARSETESCSRDTDGNRCGDIITGGWQACMGFANACDETGEQIRQVTTPTCVGGTCTNSTSNESQGCTIDTDGNNCGAPTFGPFGACNYSNQCDESATRTRSVMTPTCGSGSCGSVTSSQSEACTRDTDGTSCGSVTFGPWSACGGFSDVCDITGTRTRSVMTPTCSSGGCSTVTTTETGSCTRSNPGRNYNQTCCSGAGVTACAQGSCLNNRCVAYAGGFIEERDIDGDPAVCRGNPLAGGACACPSGFIEQRMGDLDGDFDEGNGAPTILYACRGATDSPGADFRGAWGSTSGNFSASSSCTTNECFPNAFTGTCSCPAGTASLEAPGSEVSRGSNDCQSRSIMCANTSAELTFGGRYINGLADTDPSCPSAGACVTSNPFTGSCSCPSGFTSVTGNYFHRSGTRLCRASVTMCMRNP